MSVSLLLAERIVASDSQLEQGFGYPLNRVMQLVWPSSFWLLATDGIEKTARGYLFVLISVTGNVLLYAIVGSLIWSIVYLVQLRNK